MSPSHVVVDGSNIATEGRSTPSLKQLDEAIREFQAEHPGYEVIVVVDATFGHRIDASERAMFDEAVAHGELVTPPAGAIGRGDAFVLRVAERVGAQVLSNDSFQEFHAEHPWLFEEGRLMGGKPVPGVGWIFTPRLPVRGPRSRAATSATTGRGRRARSGSLDDGSGPSAGAAKTTKAAKTIKPPSSPKVGDVIRPPVAGDVIKVAKADKVPAKAAKAPAKAAKTAKAAKEPAKAAKVPRKGRQDGQGGERAGQGGQGAGQGNQGGKGRQGNQGGERAGQGGQDTGQGNQGGQGGQGDQDTGQGNQGGQDHRGTGEDAGCRTGQSRQEGLGRSGHEVLRDVGDHGGGGRSPGARGGQGLATGPPGPKGEKRGRRRGSRRHRGGHRRGTRHGPRAARPPTGADRRRRRHRRPSTTPSRS